MEALLGTVAASVIGGLFGQSAADAQTDASQAATDLAAEQFDYQKETAEPYLDAGYSALEQLLVDLLGEETGATGSEWVDPAMQEIAYTAGATNTTGAPGMDEATLRAEYEVAKRGYSEEDTPSYEDWKSANGYDSAGDLSTTTTQNKWTVGGTDYYSYEEAEQAQGELYGTAAQTEADRVTTAQADEATANSWLQELSDYYLSSDGSSSEVDNGSSAADYNTIWDGFQQYSDSDYYNYMYDRGQDSVDQYLAQTGLMFSGDALEAQTEYGQMFAADQWDNYYDQSLAMADELRSQGSYDLSQALSMYNMEMSDQAYSDSQTQLDVDNLFTLMGYGSNAAGDLTAASSSYSDAATNALYNAADADSYAATNWANSLNSGISNYLTTSTADSYTNGSNSWSYY